MICKIPLVNWAQQQAQTANKQRYQWAQFILGKFLCKLSFIISAQTLWLSRFSMCFPLTGDSNDNKPAVGAEEEEVAKMGCPSLGEHTKLEVVIEESYEFKVSPVNQEEQYRFYGLTCSVSHVQFLSDPHLLVPMVTVSILEVTGVR